MFYFNFIILMMLHHTGAARIQVHGKVNLGEEFVNFFDSLSHLVGKQSYNDEPATPLSPGLGLEDLDLLNIRNDAKEKEVSLLEELKKQPDVANEHLYGKHHTRNAEPKPESKEGHNYARNAESKPSSSEEDNHSSNAEPKSASYVNYARNTKSEFASSEDNNHTRNAEPKPANSEENNHAINAEPNPETSEE